MPISLSTPPPVEYKSPEGLEYTHYRYAAGFDLSSHSHRDALEIYFFLDGVADYTIEGKRYSLSHGDILLVNNDLLHCPHLDASHPYERIVLSLELKYLSSFSSHAIGLESCFQRAASLKHHAIPLKTSDQATAVYQCLARMEEEIQNVDSMSGAMIDAAALQLLAHLNRAYGQSVKQTDGITVLSNDLTDRIVQHINENLTESLSLESLSEFFFVSKYHLAREFKKYTGYTVHRFVQKKRLLVARVLLREKSNILDVSGQCGFSDYSTFVRAFKTEYGMTPYQYMHPFLSGK